jgi:hypothetical protein
LHLVRFGSASAERRQRAIRAVACPQHRVSESQDQTEEALAYRLGEQRYGRNLRGIGYLRK